MALRVISDFEYAAVERVRVNDSAGEIRFAAPLHKSPRGMWFHFKVAGGEDRPVTFVVTNCEQMLGRSDYARAVPVYRYDDGPWKRVDPESCVLDESGEVTSFRAAAQDSRMSFRFVVPVRSPMTEIAYCYPFTPPMIDAAYSRWAGNSDVEIVTVCKSEGGRPLRVARIGKPAKGRKLIWVLARQHAGEVSGSHTAEGFVEALLGRTAWARRLRKEAVVYVCLAVDIDGVSEGMYGKDRSPIDFNRDWCAYPRRREIVALRKAMDESRLTCGGEKKAPMDILLDLHAPGPGGVSFPVPPHPAWSGRQPWQRAWWLAKLIERFCPENSPIRWANSYPSHIDWSIPAWTGRNASTFHAANGLARFSMTVELAYHWQASNRLASPGDWHRMGLAIARACEQIVAGKASPPRNVQPPDPPNYISPFWGWLSTPRQCNAKANEDLISVQADGPQGLAALMFSEQIPLGRGRFEARATLSRTSHRKCPMQRLIFYFKDGVFTGEVSEQKGELGSQPAVQWRSPIKRKLPADSARLGVIIRNWPGTITISRPERK